MKKIFATVLAITIIFSMTFAFALTERMYADFSWECLPYYDWRGKAVVEVVPYVHTNAACDSDEFVVSDCAAAIKGENVYYAIKLTVDACPLDTWFDFGGKVVVKTDGLDAAAETTVLWDGINFCAKEKTVYYLMNDSSEWVQAKYAEFDTAEADGNTETIPVIFKSIVTKATDAKVCAVLEFYNDGKGGWFYGDYTVDAYDAPDTLIFMKDDEKVTFNTYAYRISSIEATSADFFAEIVDVFNLKDCAIGTCITEENIASNFGWDYEQEDCFAWSTKGSAVVDTDCVVAIPKTGDVSVVAYAVMAVAAAINMF